VSASVVHGHCHKGFKGVNGPLIIFTMVSEPQNVSLKANRTWPHSLDHYWPR